KRDRDPRPARRCRSARRCHRLSARGGRTAHPAGPGSGGRRARAILDRTDRRWHRGRVPPCAPCRRRRPDRSDPGHLVCGTVQRFVRAMQAAATVALLPFFLGEYFHPATGRAYGITTLTKLRLAARVVRTTVRVQSASN